MDIGIFAKVLTRPTLAETLRLIRTHGLRHTQFNMACVGLPSMPDEIPPSLARQIHDTFAEHGVTMAAVSGTFNMIHPDRAQVDDGLRRLGVLIAASRGMGTRVVTLCTGTRDPDDMWRWHPDNATDAAWNDLLRAMERALTLAEANGITLAVEPEHANVIDSARKARRLLDHFRTPHLKIIIDPANLFERAEPAEIRRLVEEAFDLLGDDIVIAHAKDRDAAGRFAAAGQGILDYDHYIAQLRRLNYQGAMVLHGLTEAEIQPAVRFLREKLGTA